MNFNCPTIHGHSPVSPKTTVFSKHASILYKYIRRRTWGRTQFFGSASRTPHMVRKAETPLCIIPSSNFVFYQPNFSPKCFGFRHLVSDRTDRQTDRRNKYVLGLPCFKKLSSEFLCNVLLMIGIRDQGLSGTDPIPTYFSCTTTITCHSQYSEEVLVQCKKCTVVRRLLFRLLQY